MCSMSTGHSRTHAPHVTQSHTTSSVTAFGTSGCSSTVPAEAVRIAGASPATWSRRSMISSFGDSGFPVAHAGQTSWHRPHSVHVNRSSSCLLRQIRGDPGTQAHVGVGRLEVDAKRLEPPARPGLGQVDVRRGREDVQVLRSRQERQEAEHEQQVQPDQHMLGELGAVAAAEQPRQEVRDRHRAGIGQPERDSRGVPEQQGRDDPEDPHEDAVGLAASGFRGTDRAASPCGSRRRRTPRRRRRWRTRRRGR